MKRIFSLVVVTALLSMLVVSAWAGHYQSNSSKPAKEVAESSFVFFVGDKVSVHNATGKSQPLVARTFFLPYSFIKNDLRTIKFVHRKRLIVGGNVLPVLKFFVRICRFVGIPKIITNPCELTTDDHYFGRSAPLVFPEKFHIGLSRVRCLCAFGLFDENPWTFRIYDRLSLRTSRSSVFTNRFVLASDSGQSPQSSNNGEHPYDNKSPICPEAGPPWRWPVLRLAIGCVCLFIGAWMIVRFGYGRIRLGVCGSCLFAVGWLLLLAPSGW